MMPEGAARPPRYVFVYGTLRRGALNDIAHFAPAAEHVGVASIEGTLFDLGAYPGVVLGGEGRVLGEVYRIEPELEAQLDVLEEVLPGGSGEYIKREVRVCSIDGDAAWDCLVYEIHPERLAHRRVIAGGDWLQR